MLPAFVLADELHALADQLDTRPRRQHGDIDRVGASVTKRDFGFRGFSLLQAC